MGAGASYPDGRAGQAGPGAQATLSRIGSGTRGCAYMSADVLGTMGNFIPRRNAARHTMMIFMSQMGYNLLEDVDRKKWAFGCDWGLL